jgi:uncharacterized protein
MSNPKTVLHRVPDPATPRSERSRVLTVLLALVGALLLTAASLLALVWWQQERLLFRPQVLSADHRFDRGPDVAETWVDVPGARLNALHLKLPKPDGVVFFLHGNAGSLDNWFLNPHDYRSANMDLFMVDYRGYGKSTGSIQSEAQLMADVRAAWTHIAPQYAGKRRVFFGRSLGTGLAAQLAADMPPSQQPDLLMLVSPYSSMVALAQTHYRWVPSALLRYPLRSDAALARVKSPVWLAHGALDTLIPPSHSQALQAVAPQASLLLVPGAAHGDLQQHPAYLQAVIQAMGQTIKQP